MRRAAIVLICVAVVVLAGVGYYYYWHQTGANSAKTSGAAPALVSLLPAQSPYILYADLESLRKSAFLAKLVAIAPSVNEDPDYGQFVRETGFDYTRDLDHIAFAMLPKSPEPEVWTVAEGRFDEQKIVAYAVRVGRVEQRNGRTTYIVPAGRTADEVEFSFIAPGRIQMISKQKGISAAVAPGGAIASDAAMREHVSRVAGAAIFAVLSTDALPKDVTIGTARLDEVQTVLHGIHWLSIAVMPDGQDLRIVLEGDATSTAEAIQLELGLEGFRILGRGILTDPATRKQLTKEGANSLDNMIQRVGISRDGQRVRLSVSLSPDTLNGLAAPPPAMKQTTPVLPPAGTKPAR